MVNNSVALQSPDEPDAPLRFYWDSRGDEPKAVRAAVLMDRAMEQVIAANLALLFPGMQVVSAHPFRVTRNADVQRNEEEAEDAPSTDPITMLIPAYRMIEQAARTAIRAHREARAADTP